MTIGYLLDNFWVAPTLEERVITRESTLQAKTIKPMHERYKRAKHHVSLRVYLVQHYYTLQQGYEPPPQTPRASHFSQPPRGIDESMKMVIGSKSELSDLWTRPSTPPGKHLPSKLGR